jgi:type IV secretion system protein VirD4
VAAEDGGLRWEAEPEAPDCVAPEAPTPTSEPELAIEDAADGLPALQARFRRLARQAALDPDDGLGL